MKKAAFIIPILFVVQTYGQGPGNFLSQKKADIQYMLDQILALKTYASYAEKGYDIAQKGLTAIGDFKKGEFDLHTAFFLSLNTVNPTIKKDQRIGDIIDYQQAIMQAFTNCLEQMKRSGSFSPTESVYVTEVYNNISGECVLSLQELIDVLTDKQLEMSDDERINRIAHIYEAMKDRYAFARSFTREVSLLGAQRTNESSEIDLLKKLN